MYNECIILYSCKCISPISISPVLDIISPPANLKPFMSVRSKLVSIYLDLVVGIKFGLYGAQCPRQSLKFISKYVPRGEGSSSPALVK